MLRGALELAEAGFVPGGARSNRSYLGEALLTSGVSDAMLSVFLDPQTSGGLLFAVHPDDARALSDELAAAGELAVEIGQLVQGSGKVVLQGQE